MSTLLSRISLIRICLITSNTARHRPLNLDGLGLTRVITTTRVNVVLCAHTYIHTRTLPYVSKDRYATASAYPDHHQIVSREAKKACVGCRKKANTMREILHISPLSSTVSHLHLSPPSLDQPTLQASHHSSLYLTSSRARNVGALGALFAAGNRVARPSPVGASALGTQDVNRHGVGRNAAGDAGDGQAGDGHAGGGSAGRRAVLVVLLDDDAVFGDLRRRRGS
jgi:hypothetical protein